MVICTAQFNNTIQFITESHIFTYVCMYVRMYVCTMYVVTTKQSSCKLIKFYNAKKGKPRGKTKCSGMGKQQHKLWGSNEVPVNELCDALLVIRSPVAKHKVVLLTKVSPGTDYSLNTGDWSLAMALLLPRAVSPQGRRPSLPTMPLMCLYHCHMEQLLRVSVRA